MDFSRNVSGIVDELELEKTYDKSIIKFRFLNEKPDGTPRKLADTTKLNNLGWSPDISLADGLRSTYKWYTEYRVG